MRWGGRGASAMGKIGSLTLTPGIYTFNNGTNVEINSEVYLDSATATGINTGSNGTFIIQMAGNLMVAADTKVILKSGVLAENVFWQVAGNVKVMAGATMEGILLAKTDVTFITGSTLVCQRTNTSDDWYYFERIFLHFLGITYC